MSEWFCDQVERHPIPFSSSYDIRDSGIKIANVDGNIYPAGFNNICSKDHAHSIELVRCYLQSKYGKELSRVALMTEEHTQNPYYWDNVLAIESLLLAAGFKVLIGLPRLGEATIEIQSASGKKVQVCNLDASTQAFRDFAPQVIISNNDFSLPLQEWVDQISVPIDPPQQMGWFQRKKSQYFLHYNALVSEFSKVANFDPFYLSVMTESFSDFDVSDSARMQVLAEQVEKFLSKIRAQYQEHGIDQKPVVFIKNDAGTYGLAVIKVESGEDVLALNNRSRTKMKAAKGGRGVQDVILQEGIPTRVQDEGRTAEPVIYMIGADLAGGFLRVHGEKSATESLNSPGSVFKKLCVSDLKAQLEGLPLENVYGWTARLGLLAMGRESEMLLGSSPAKKQTQVVSPTDFRTT